MAAQIDWTLNVQVSGGPQVSDSSQVEVEAYDKLSVSLDASQQAKQIEVQPGGAGQVQFLLIQSSKYHTADLTYSVGAAEADKNQRKKLDAPQVLLGSGAVELLGTPDKLFFYNDLAEDLTIDVLVGRDATP